MRARATQTFLRPDTSTRPAGPKNGSEKARDGAATSRSSGVSRSDQIGTRLEAAAFIPKIGVDTIENGHVLESPQNSGVSIQRISQRTNVYPYI